MRRGCGWAGQPPCYVPSCPLGLPSLLWPGADHGAEPFGQAGSLTNRHSRKGSPRQGPRAVAGSPQRLPLARVVSPWAEPSSSPKQRALGAPRPRPKSPSGKSGFSGSEAARHLWPLPPWVPVHGLRVHPVLTQAPIHPRLGRGRSQEDHEAGRARTHARAHAGPTWVLPARTLPGMFTSRLTPRLAPSSGL